MTKATAFDDLSEESQKTIQEVSQSYYSLSNKIGEFLLLVQRYNRSSSLKVSENKLQKVRDGLEAAFDAKNQIVNQLSSQLLNIWPKKEE